MDMHSDNHKIYFLQYNISLNEEIIIKNYIYICMYIIFVCVKINIYI